jgi:nucleoside-diphosphate kinase
MAGNRTLTIIKPDAFNSGKAGPIIAHLEKAGFKVIASRVMRLTEAQASAFYEVHRERPFFTPLVRFMTSGKCMPIVLERRTGVALAGRRSARPTLPKPRRERSGKLYAESKERNAIHASDSDENADRESKFFFPEAELV